MRTFILIAFFHLLVLISPGQNFALVLRNAVKYQRRSGLWVALGISLGSLTHISYSLLGVTAVIAHSPVLYTVLKWLGAGYLIYIGVKALGIQNLRSRVDHAASSHEKLDHPAILPPLRAIRMGYLSDVLNPKPGLFFLAIFTQTLSPHTPIILKLAYGSEMVIATFAWFAFLTILSTHHYVRRHMRQRQHHLERVFGVLLIIIGLNLLVSH